MDGQRFDVWTRALAARLSRRTAGRAAVAGAGAALLTRAGEDPASAACSPKGEHCMSGRDCCRKLVCILNECDECVEKGHLCDDDGQCCRGLTCKHRECKKK